MSIHTTTDRLRKRVRLGAKTVAVLNALAARDQAGGRAAELASACDITLRGAVARLRWLKRVALANCAAGNWTVVDGGLFRQQQVRQ